MFMVAAKQSYPICFTSVCVTYTNALSIHMHFFDSFSTSCKMKYILACVYLSTSGFCLEGLYALCQYPGSLR